MLEGNRFFRGYVDIHVSRRDTLDWKACGGERVMLTSTQEREAEFRDQSEHTNSRVVRWTLIQLVILGVTCVWQLSHLRAFFIKQKLT
jgi:hypothetical protein